MNDNMERATASGSLEPYRSLARHAGVPVEDVLAAAAAGDLRALVDRGIERRTVMAKFRGELERREQSAEFHRSRRATMALRRRAAALMPGVRAR